MALLPRNAGKPAPARVQRDGVAPAFPIEELMRKGARGANALPDPTAYQRANLGRGVSWPSGIAFTGVNY